MPSRVNVGVSMQAYYRKALRSGQGVPVLFTAHGHADLSVLQ